MIFSFFYMCFAKIFLSSLFFNILSLPSDFNTVAPLDRTGKQGCKNKGMSPQRHALAIVHK